MRAGVEWDAGFSNATIPMDPNESSFSRWTDFLRPVLALLWVGMGIGLVLSSVPSVPAWLGFQRLKRRANSRKRTDPFRRGRRRGEDRSGR